MLENDFSLASAIGSICKKYPQSSADTLLLGTISFVTNFDASIGIDSQLLIKQSRERYGLIAALAAEIALLNTSNRLCSDLSQFWYATSNQIFR